MADIKYEIKEKLDTISESAKGWKKELNLVLLNCAAPQYDLRDWAPKHEKMGNGVTLSADEVKELYKILKNIVEDQNKKIGGSVMAKMSCFPANQKILNTRLLYRTKAKNI